MDLLRNVQGTITRQCFSITATREAEHSMIRMCARSCHRVAGYSTVSMAEEPPDIWNLPWSVWVAERMGWDGLGARGQAPGALCVSCTRMLESDSCVYCPSPPPGASVAWAVLERSACSSTGKLPVAVMVYLNMPSSNGGSVRPAEARAAPVSPCQCWPSAARSTRSWPVPITPSRSATPRLASPISYRHRGNATQDELIYVPKSAKDSTWECRRQDGTAGAECLSGWCIRARIGKPQVARQLG